MEQMNIVLLLTGTVRPENMILTKLLDPTVRKEQYLDALNFWLTHTDFPIVFVENSGVDLSAHFESGIASGRLEILTFRDGDHSNEFGKGYGEINCMRYAHTHSALLQKADFLFKVTGRLKVINFRSFAKPELLKNVDVTADLSNTLAYADSRFWGYAPAFFARHLAGLQHELNDSRGVYFEHILAKSIIGSVREGGSFRPFNTRLRVEGVSGTSKKSYHSGFVVWYIRDLVKKMKHRSLIKSLDRIGGVHG